MRLSFIRLGIGLSEIFLDYAIFCLGTTVTLVCRYSVSEDVDAVGQEGVGVLLSSHHPLHYIFDIVTEVNAFYLAALFMRVHESMVLRCSMASREELCAPSYGDMPEVTLDGVIVHIIY